MTMPHVNSGGSDDFFSNDEVKSYKYEGDEEKKSSENLSEDKLGLVTETEEVKGGYTGNEKSDRRTEDGKSVQSQGDRDVPPFGFPPGFPPYHNGATPPNSMPPGSIPPPYLFWVQGSKFPMIQSPLVVGSYNDSPFTSPPPAHMGIPPVTIDPKTGLPRHVYPYPSPTGQFPPSLYPDVQWQRPGYPISSGALGGPYPPPLLNSTARYPPGLLPPGIPHPGLPHPFMSGPKQDGGISQDSQRHGLHEGQGPDMPEKKNKPHIKKPLNAFMLFMKEQRAKVVAECTLKESAAINQILGRRWHSLDRSEQAKYYEMARKEKELHLQLYPGWSARDNYATHSKKKKRKKDMGTGGEKGMRPEDRYLDNPAFGDCTQSKKCRARFGMDQQKNWCKPCRRKKKCIRVYEDGNTYSDGEDEPMSDGVATGDSFHDSDSMLGSPAHSSASEDVFSTPHKARLKSVESPLVHSSGGHSHDLSDVDMTICDNNITPVPQRSPMSLSKSERYLSSSWHIPSLGSPASSVKSVGSSRGSYSIDSLAISAATPERQPTRELDNNGLSPLSSPGIASPLNMSQQDSPRFGLSTYTEDINRNISPKKSKSSGLNNSFSISTLSVSAVTPSRVHVT